LAHPQLPALESLAQSVAEPLGFRIHHLLLHSHRSPQALIVALQRQEGQQVTDVNLDDCATFSAAFAEALDLGELLAGAYVLEITSPGVGDVLQDDRDFRSFRGFPVSVLQHDANGDQLRREGSLLRRDDDAVEINLRGRVVRIPRSAVLEVRLTSPEG
jgi:ribosome maturation factor RimP